MRARLADEDGFTLVELLAALVVGTIVLFAAFGLLDTAVRLQAKSVDSIEATDRGRVGIDQISQAFSSGICLGDQPSLVSASDSDVEFYASLAPESSAVRLVVQRRRLTVTPTGIREDVWSGSPPVAPPSLPPASTTTPTRTRMVVTGIRQIASTPIFRYYANQGAPARPTLLLPAPLSAGDLSRAVLIDVSFSAQGKRAEVHTDYTNQIVNRSPTCVT
jgi:prepilin-type N-terminal cleavage/methylation domain-containing protein